MKSFTLVRHAKSSWSDGSLRDHDRPLNRRGQNDAPLMGRQLAERGCAPDRVLCSTAVRARETANLLLPHLHLPTEVISYTESIYEAGVEDLLECVSEVDSGCQHVMMIGHNPGLEMLCHTIIAGAVDRMATNAVASFQLDLQDWATIFDRVESKTGMTLVFHDTPKNHR